LSDRPYIERAKKGDPDAFSWLVDRYKSTAYSVAFRILKNRDQAEEVVQESFVKAFHSVSRFRGESNFSTWLFRIVYNTSISLTRKKSRERLRKAKMAESPVNYIDLDDGLKKLSEKESRACIRQALERLNETDYTLLTLFYYEDKPLKEICKITGLKYSYVKVRIQRARKKLYHELKSLMKTEIYDLL